MIRHFPEEVFLGFQEIPIEISLIIPLAGCGHKCIGCHSPHYQNSDNGIALTADSLFSLLDSYKNKATCVCFFGGEDTYELSIYLKEIKRMYKLKTALYSGFDCLGSLDIDIVNNLDYIKLGRYKKELGGLDNKNTNQKLFKIVDGSLENITHLFWRNND